MINKTKKPAFQGVPWNGAWRLAFSVLVASLHVERMALGLTRRKT